jgi:hypothetical protein
MKIEKHKLPKGFSYALKSSMLEKAFTENNIITTTQLIYSKSDIFFDAYYWLPNHNVDYSRFYIRAGHVQSDQRKAALQYTQDIVIPDFIRWAKELFSLPEDNTKLLRENYFRRNFT